MNPGEQASLVALVRAPPLPRQQVLAQLGLARSSYYDWLRRGEDRTDALRPLRRPAWNRLRPQEEQAVLAVARASPELSPRQLALSLTDTGSFSVSESTCYRLLKRHGLVKPAEVGGFAAEKEYRRKTERPNQMWATDGAYLKVARWGKWTLGRRGRRFLLLPVVVPQETCKRFSLDASDAAYAPGNGLSDIG